jgi:undecaprenyl diphosphate synthase
VNFFEDFNIDPNNIPSHLAVIMDGNGRWAQKEGQGRTFGHENGVESVRSVVEGCAELGIKHLTLYAFSTENWNRPPEEIAALMGILVSSITGEEETLQKSNIRLNAIGDLEKLPDGCKDTLDGTMERTAGNDNLVLTLALSYSGRWELVEMTKKLAAAAANGELAPEDIDEEMISSHLSTAGLPDPELMIRTSGEFRISNFLLWQLAYSEIHITDVLWPDFRKEHLAEAILNYQSRERRFGKTSEQVS